MKNHVKVYLKHFGYGLDSFIPCEICGCRAVDIHHIEARGMGGSKSKDDIQNLMALCREHHVEYGDKKQHVEFLVSTHKSRLK
jgi:hypothetical protein